MGRVIKAGVNPVQSLPLHFQTFERYPTNEVSAEEQAASMLDHAKMQADIIVRTANAEAETIREHARQEGYEQGRQAGMSEAATAIQPLLQRLEVDTEAVNTETQEFFNSLEPELLKLCLDTVEKVIRHEAKTDPRVVTRIIKSCLRRVKESHEVRVRVNPAEVAAVRAQRDELLSVAEGITAINIVDDRRISPGGCVIETATGDFDATIETQMGRVEQVFTETFENDRE